MKLKHTPTQDLKPNLLLRFLVKRSDRNGFTLLELLIAMVISSIVVSGLLSLVVNILQTNQRDASRSDTQRDMQMAMDYIVRDVREAAYVYGVTQATNADGTLGNKESCLHSYGDALDRGRNSRCTGLLSFLPPFLTSPNNIPVLAFWKPEPLPSGMRTSCRANSQNVGKLLGETGFNADLNAVPCVSQRMYTLVVYSLNTQPAGTFSWKGKARITRYQLPNFTEIAVVGPRAVNPGWAAPIAKDKRPLTWPVGDTSTATNINVQNRVLDIGQDPTLNVVLTDFVDFKTDIISTTYVPKSSTTGGHCPSGFDSPNGFSTGARFNSAFYVCVRSGSLTSAPGTNTATAAAIEAAAAAGQGLNPEVHIVLRGNAAGRGGIPTLTGEVPFQMETRVLSRGAFGKFSNNDLTN